ncbi:M56 family metallopeptidase [Streptomyces sp. NPDC058691]|uniref:M56 family metallopeptidase n=1 Tax=Streptomyces sp. NPDC058691 TaxID=3346601 RepID=UPI00365E0703
MIALLLIPLIAPFALPPLARRTVERIRPDVALWAVAGASGVLAVGVLACLGALVLPVALQVPVLASFMDVVHPLDAGRPMAVRLLAAVSGVALGVCVVALCRAAVRLLGRLRAVQAGVAGRASAGDLCVVEDDRPDAYALPGRRRTPGRIVVTTGMLRALSPAQREVLFAHERAHLAGRHHWFLAVADLAARCHPGLHATRCWVTLAAERAADEEAASANGDRRLTAHAIGHAALAVTASASGRPVHVPGATGGPVPARVRALLAQAPRRRVAPVLLAVLLLCTGAATAAMSGAADLHRAVEVAQGESAGD